MFGNEEDLKNSIPNSMLISIIHPNPAKNDFSQRILEKTGIELKERLKFSCLSNYKDIYKDIEKPSSQKETQSSRGLINKKWIDDLYNRRPALIIYFYQIPNGVNKSMEEKKIYENLLEIKKSDDLVYIGDSDVDANTIINASIKGILVSYGYRDKGLLLKFGLPIVDNVSELEEMINRIK